MEIRWKHEYEVLPALGIFVSDSTAEWKLSDGVFGDSCTLFITLSYFLESSDPPTTGIDEFFVLVARAAGSGTYIQNYQNWLSYQKKLMRHSWDLLLH